MNYLHRKKNRSLLVSPVILYILLLILLPLKLAGSQEIRNGVNLQDEELHLKDSLLMKKKDTADEIDKVLAKNVKAMAPKGDDSYRQMIKKDGPDIELNIDKHGKKSEQNVDGDSMKKNTQDRGFIHGFVASLSIIIISELGDKTFFIAAIMAMKYSRMPVFGGAILALAVMTILSVIVGYATFLIPRKYTYYASTILFVIFGLKLLREGYYMAPDEGQEDLEEVSAELKKREESLMMEVNASSTADVESGAIRGTPSRAFRYCKLLVSPIFMQAFVMTFLAEWGDRSQIMTIVLAAREDFIGVTIGGILGHTLCTSLAVIGGRMLAQKISTRTVTLLGGVIFLIFAATALFQNPETMS